MSKIECRKSKDPSGINLSNININDPVDQYDTQDLAKKNAVANAVAPDYGMCNHCSGEVLASENL